MNPDPSMTIKVRFAPSPTGPFSIGNARTALFNWLVAKKHNGKFYLRIEDTDEERSKIEFEQQIINSLQWLGLNWDDQIIRQSERKEIYKNYLQKLLDEGKAYYCFCSLQELEAERQAQLSQGLIPKYSGRCRNIDYNTAKERAKKEKYVIRFKMPETQITFTDKIHGRVSFDTSLFGDIIIAKSLTQPIWHFAVVIDDYEMGITDVIRGEDHLTNTPKQIMIQKALNFPQPRYAHLPLILGSDRKKLSKRYLDYSLLDYKRDGYLPQALVNFIVLLGWHPQKNKEVLSVDEIIQEFSLERVQKSGAIYNPEKLNWLNSYYIKKMTDNELLNYIIDILPPDWNDKEKILKIIHIEKERIIKLTDLFNIGQFFFKLPDYEPKLLIWKFSEPIKVLNNLQKILQIAQNIDNEQKFIDQIQQLAETTNRGEVLWPLRVALSGQEASPGPFDIINVLGLKESLARIQIAVDKFKNFLYGNNK
ncbi:MAG: glutamate--tRNA ligase [Minisyncoccia bacterium]